MATKHIHFPLTTAPQRKLLFEIWQATGNVTAACRTAHVGRGTFYYWKPRFDAQGFPGLKEFASRAAKEPHRTPAAVAQQVLALRRSMPIGARSALPMRWRSQQLGAAGRPQHGETDLARRRSLGHP